jgi:hypothetical protein
MPMRERVDLISFGDALDRRAVEREKVVAKALENIGDAAVLFTAVQGDEQNRARTFWPL